MGDFPAETYDPATFVTPEKPNVGRDELIAAAHVIHDLLKANDISHGFLGGFALMLAGNLRTTKDLDCCFEVANKAHLRGVLEQEASLCIPTKKMMAGATKIFVKLPNKKRVQVDLLEAGQYGTVKQLSRYLDFYSNRDPFPCVNWSILTRGKLRASVSRTANRDIDDLMFLISLSRTGDETHKIDINLIKLDDVEGLIEYMESEEGRARYDESAYCAKELRKAFLLGADEDDEDEE